MARPAYTTKHKNTLEYPFKDTTFTLQQSDDGQSNGTTLWLGAQILTAFVAEHYSSKPAKVIELGSGIGLTALSMDHLGWQVTATDIPPVLDILRRNTRGTQITVLELDWMAPVPPMDPFDLILTADTIYLPSLAKPLIDTIHALSTRKPPVLLCMERRDRDLIDNTLAYAREKGFKVERIPQHKMFKAMVKNGLEWEKSEWEGVEMYKLKLGEL